MNTYQLLLLLFISASNIFTINASTYPIYYKSPLSLTLIESGVDAFLDSAKQHTDHEYRTALYDVIELASSNNTSVPSLISRLRSTLNDRIGRIEQRIQRKGAIDYNALRCSAGFIALGLVLSYAIYYRYSERYCPSSRELRVLEATFKAKGISRYKIGNENIFEIPQFDQESNWDMVRRYVDLCSINDKLMDSLVMWSLLLPIPAFLFGICGAVTELSPRHDDEYLEKYKTLLAITEEVNTTTLHEQ
jgi:hypothetical protein